ncbi:helix-turn-helix domain-containing protein [Adlercreutzia sp. R21]|uniref:helix-turn-helix domain-containing protein n=1 Tax=Adlercreutzia wanghongyangiae TaxID=3111451 RepID=UPI002DB57ABE|nr:helix-turn-helix domain-containing protein [Adlercreutzia sp. R21]MEC4184316.1 helix-turn-helix domain-containing protein [Adlercreutzia sp. R21]
MRETDMSCQIKEIRKRYGLSQQAFARLLGIGEASITRYENGIVPTKANANLIRAAMIPEFMAGCLEREGDALTPKQRASVEKIVYAEVTFDEEGEIMDMTDIYEITLQQEVLNEKAAEILGDVINGLIQAEEENDEGLKMVYEDIFAQLSLLKPKIASTETANWKSLHNIDGELDCMRSLCNRVQRRAA